MQSATGRFLLSLASGRTLHKVLFVMQQKTAHPRQWKRPRWYWVAQSINAILMWTATALFAATLWRWGLSSPFVWTCLVIVAVAAVVFMGIEFACDQRRPERQPAADRPAA